MNDHDVRRIYVGRELVGQLVIDLVIDRLLFRSDVRVSFTVNQIVHAFRKAEEVGIVGFDYGPDCNDAQVSQ